MANCLNKLCGKEVAQVKGKRQRRTCCDSCRQLFYKQSREDSKGSKMVSVDRAVYDALVAELEGLKGGSEVVPSVVTVVKSVFREILPGEDRLEYAREKGEWKNIQK